MHLLTENPEGTELGQTWAPRAWPLTLAGVVSSLLEAWLAGAEGVGPVGDAVGLVSVSTQGPVTPAVVQLGVCTSTHSH